MRRLQEEGRCIPLLSGPRVKSSDAYNLGVRKTRLPRVDGEKIASLVTNTSGDSESTQWSRAKGAQGEGAILLVHCNLELRLQWCSSTSMALRPYKKGVSGKGSLVPSQCHSAAPLQSLSAACTAQCLKFKVQP
eukprot:1143793-Pelagomonas_calceolata.AAC.5